MVLCHRTPFGRFVVAVEDDREGLVDRITRSVPVEDVARLSRKAEEATTVEEKLDALLSLASMPGVVGGIPPSGLERAVRRALDDASPLVRLTAMRATSVLPAATAFSVLDGRDDPENPALEEWREHYRSIVQREG
jgi:hypothetical protein